MRKFQRLLLCLAAAFFLIAAKRDAFAAGPNTIPNGVTADGMALSGMTQDQAAEAIRSYAGQLKSLPVTLLDQNGGNVTVTAGQLGLEWENTRIVQDAAQIGRQGNIVKRYKELQDLAHKGRDFHIELGFDRNAIAGVVKEQCSRFNVEAVDAQLSRNNGVFEVVEGRSGYMVDVDASVSAIYEYLTGQWDRQACSVNLVGAVDEPEGRAEDLMQVKDLLGTFTTSYASSGSDRSKNVANGCSLINGTTLYPGQTFSTYDAVKPFTEENGYYMAGSYLNGQVVDSIGGGICQVSTTLYNAVLLAELEVTERHNHSMIVTYVDPSADAAIAESSGKDFQFVNNTDHPIYIEGYTKDKHITFNLYGVETRDPARTVSYESEVLERIEPDSEVIVADASQPVGFLHTSAEHIGYKAQLWKIVKENGVEVSREKVNSSNYQVSPRTITVGTATSDANISSIIAAAIASNSSQVVKETLANIQATQDQLAEIAAAQAAAAQAAQDAAAGN